MVWNLLAPAIAGYLGSKSKDVGDAADSVFGPNKNNYQEDKPFEVDYNGALLGNRDFAAQQSKAAWDIMEGQKGQQEGFYNQAMTGANAARVDPVYWAAEQLNGGLPEQAESRGDQRDALGLMAAAARGEAPSQAQALMAQGMNQAIAQGQAAAGGARGAAALANAQSNAAANTMNLQQSTANQMAALRANEMAQARGEYGGMANQLRGTDLARLKQASEMSMFNAGNVNQANLANAQMKNQYMLGMGGNAVGMGGNVNQGFVNSQRPLEKQADINTQQQMIANQAHQATEDRKAGVAQSRAQSSQQTADRNWGIGLGLINTGMQAGMAGGKPKA